MYSISSLEFGVAEACPEFLLLQRLSNLGWCAGVAAFIKGWDMALVLLSVVPVLVIVVGAIGTFLSRSQKQASAAYGEANSIAQEALAAIRTVLAFNSQDTITKRYSQVSD